MITPKQNFNNKDFVESLLSNSRSNKLKRRLVNTNSVSPVLPYRDKQELGYGTRSLNFREKSDEKIKSVG